VGVWLFLDPGDHVVEGVAWPFGDLFTEALVVLYVCMYMCVFMDVCV
jgi:hypothetical protein